MGFFGASDRSVGKGNLKFKRPPWWNGCLFLDRQNQSSVETSWMIHPIIFRIHALIIRVWGWDFFCCCCFLRVFFGHPYSTEAVCWLASCAIVEFFSPPKALCNFWVACCPRNFIALQVHEFLFACLLVGCFVPSSGLGICCYMKCLSQTGISYRRVYFYMWEAVNLVMYYSLQSLDLNPLCQRWNWKRGIFFP